MQEEIRESESFYRNGYIDPDSVDDVLEEQTNPDIYKNRQVKINEI